MSLTQKQLSEMNEDQLRTSILLPLFKAMGFLDVHHYHGGTLELGKDIVMWKPGDIDERVNYGVVVKASKITGRASGSSSAAEVRFQIEQCFSKPYSDPVTAQEQKINRCFVVSSKKITKEALNAIEGVLEESNLKNVTTFVNGDKLWELIEEYLPQRAVWEQLRQVQRVFDEANPHYRITVRTTKTGPKLSIEPKSPDSETKHPISITGQFTFPETAEGQKMREAFDRHIKTGSPVTLTKEYIDHISIPDFLVPFLDPSGRGVSKLSLGSQRSHQTLLLKIVAEGDDGKVATLEYIHLEVMQAGTEEVTFANDRQPVPWKCQLVFNTKKKQFSFRYTVEFEAVYVKRALEAFQFQKIVSDGCVLKIEHLDTGFEMQKQKIPPGEITVPDPFWGELFEKLVFIQQKTQVPLILPNRELTDEDFRSIWIITEILKTGRGLFAPGVYTIETDMKTAQMVLETFEGGELMPVSFGGIEAPISVLDIPIPLGPTNLNFEQAYIAEETLSALRDTLSTAKPEDAIKIHFTSSEGSKVRAEFLNWVPSE